MRNQKLKLDGYGGYSGTCKQCHAEFQTQQNFTLFCSTKCRVAYARRKKSIQRHRNDALYAIRALAALTKDVADWAEDINVALRMIEGATDDALRLRPDKDMKDKTQMLYEFSLRRNSL
jgi:hypothetical protein